MTLPMLRILPAPWNFKMSGTRGGNDVEDSGRDKYAPLRKLAMVQVQPPRNPNKPFTSFSINDILNANGRTQAAPKSVTEKRKSIAHHQHNGHQSHIKHNNSKQERQQFSRPPPAHRHNNNHLVVAPSRIVRPWDASPPPGRNSEASSDADEEINVDEDDDDEPVSASALKDVSPLDALMEMANKTFQGLETSEAADAKRREQAALFGKHSNPKKRRKSRTAFTNQQIYELEKRFLYQKYLTPADRDEIAQNLGLTNAQVITWFQNRRAKLKRDLEELKNDVVATTTQLSVSGSSEHEFDIDDTDSESGHHTPTKRSRSESPERDGGYMSPNTTKSPESMEKKCDSPGEIVVDDKEEFSEGKES